MLPIYVTEPEVIPINQAKHALQAAGLYAVSGSIDFADSQKQPFETIVIRSATTVDKTIKQHFPQLKRVVRIGTGLDNVDVEFCKSNGISVYNAAGANADAVAEYIITMLLCVLRKLHKLHPNDVQTWNRFKFTGHSLAERTIGIIGFGNIGKALYQKLRGFPDITFLVYDPYLTPEKLADFTVTLLPLEEVLQRSSIVSLHLPLADETKHLMNSETLALMPENSLLINAARGGIVDEQAVISAVNNCGLTYVADSVEGEPHVNPNLLNNENIIITPHIASLTDASEKAMLQVAINNLLHNKPYDGQ